ncbi:hypothetical protein KR018_000272, partial [Drosophila ironensis]
DVFGRSVKRNSGSVQDDCDWASTVAHADDTDYISPGTPVGPDTDPDPENDGDCEAEHEFAHLHATRRKIFDAIAALNDESFEKHMARLLMHYESAIREEFELAQASPALCRQLARILIGLTDVIHTMVRGKVVQQEENYRQRMCHIIGYYISCELCAAQEPVEGEQCVINRISSCLKLYVEYGEGGAGVHREHVLRTLLAAPKLFNRASILSALYSRLFPHWSLPSIMIQTELPDKLYIEYILIFYYWQRLERDELVKERIVDFADRFMRPSKTLALSSIYAHYLPKYIGRNAATRTILEYLRHSSCTSLHVASRVDNRLPHSNEVVLSSDDEDSCPLWDSMGPATTTSTNNHPPVFLQNLCQNARQLEPCKRATALFSGIDNSIEIVELRDSDDEVEMFSVNFNVPANVDGNTSNSNSNDANQATTILVEDDAMAVTRIYPSNLRTYERALASMPSTTYTVPRIVNSYSCRRDSLHLVSTTAPHLVDQSVQTTVDEEFSDIALDEEPYSGHSQAFNFPPSRSASESSFSGLRTPLPHSRGSSSQNSHCSDTSLLKKQVTFSPQHLGATASCAESSPSAVAAKKPAIKRYKSTSTADRLEALRQTTRKDHFQASEKMFAKLESRNQTPCLAFSPSQLTPTSTNASSGTPPRQRQRVTSQRPKVGPPTPPASTHSSNSPCQIQRASTDTVNSIDQEKQTFLAKESSFARRKFSKVDSEQVRFYNQLLSVQREKIRRRRDQVKRAELDPKNQLKQANKQCRQLRKVNAKRRKELKQLEHDVAIIRSCALHSYPIVRLKRCNLKCFEVPEDTNPDAQVHQLEGGLPLENCGLQKQHKIKAQDREQCKFETERKRVDKECQFEVQEGLAVERKEKRKLKLKKTQQPLLGEKQQNETRPPQKCNQRKRRRRKARAVWTHVKNKKRKQWFMPHPVEEPALDSELETAPKALEQEPAAEEEPTPDPNYEEQDQEMVPEVGNELEVSAVIQEAEDNDGSRLATPAHDLELVTSNHVPVYLLNGESRDVSTPLSSSQFSA